MEKFQPIYKRAVNYGSKLQTWPGQFLMRKVETEIISTRFRFNKEDIGLEIGCGIGFQSSLIASISCKLIATDLYYNDKLTHTLGINKAKDLLLLTGINNVHLVSCCAQDLSFRNNYFDYIFSSSVLEHIKDKNKVLSEMKRVLKDDGYIIAIIPNFMLSIYAFFHLPLYIVKRSLQMIFDKIALLVFAKSAKEDNNNKAELRRFRDNHPSFPFPEPHGDYKTIVHEFFDYIPYKWEQLFKKNGFKIVSSYTTCILPWSIFEVFSTQWAAKIYQFMQGIHTTIRFPKYFSYLFCIVAQKAR